MIIRKVAYFLQDKINRPQENDNDLSRVPMPVGMVVTVPQRSIKKISYLMPNHKQTTRKPLFSALTGKQKGFISKDLPSTSMNGAG